MNKHAAEKIASEYYNMGIQLALQNAGLVKTANPLKALGLGTAGLAGGTGLAVNAELLPKMLGGDTRLAKLISEHSNRYVDKAQDLLEAGGKQIGEGAESLLQKLYTVGGI